MKHLQDHEVSLRGRTPLVSVVMPAFNCAAHLAESIDSVLSQDHTAIELWVIDDGSTDATPDILAGYGSRIHVLRQVNAGAATARNEGLRRARGQYIAFLDADDVWLPGKLRRQVAHLERHPEVGTVFCDWLRWNPAPDGRYAMPDKLGTVAETPGIAPQLSGWLYPLLLTDCVMLTSTVLMRRSVIEQVGGFVPELRRGQDYDYWLRASRIAPIHKLDALLALYRIEALPRKFPLSNWELIVIERALRRWGPSSPDGQSLSDAQLRQRLWQLHFSFGYQHYHAGGYDIAAEAFAAAARHRPLHVRSRVYGALSAVRRRGRPVAAG